MNKKGAILVVAISVILSALFLGFVGADVVPVSVSANVLNPVVRVNITPSAISFGDIVKGYHTDFVNMTFDNLGNASVEITPMLDSNTPDIFNYLEFSTVSTCNTDSRYWENISLWNASLDKPALMNGGKTEVSDCIRLNLENYNKTIAEGNYNTNLTFWISQIN